MVLAFAGDSTMTSFFDITLGGHVSGAAERRPGCDALL